MSLIALATAKGHLRTTHDLDDTLIAIYSDAAARAASQFLNRQIYADDDARDYARSIALATYQAAMAQAQADYDAADALSDVGEQCEVRAQAELSRDRARWAYRSTMDGITLVPDIEVAILLILGNAYENRSNVVVGVTAMELPHGAHSMLWPYRVGMGV